MRNKVIKGAALAAMLAAIIPATAQARDHGRHNGWDNHGRYERDYRGYDNRVYNDRRYYSDRRSVSYRCGKTSGTTGLILGGVAGALLGRSVDRYGDRTTGTVIGAGAGALLGKEIDSTRRC